MSEIFIRYLNCKVDSIIERELHTYIFLKTRLFDSQTKICFEELKTSSKFGEKISGFVKPSDDQNNRKLNCACTYDGLKFIICSGV